jgi:hypothetical protein
MKKFIFVILSSVFFVGCTTVSEFINYSDDYDFDGNSAISSKIIRDIPSDIILDKAKHVFYDMYDRVIVDSYDGKIEAHYDYIGLDVKLVTNRLVFTVSYEDIGAVKATLSMKKTYGVEQKKSINISRLRHDKFWKQLLQSLGNYR